MSNNARRRQESGFGRRGVPRAGGGCRARAAGLKPRTAAPNEDDFRYASEARAAIAAHEEAEARAERFVARYNWWLTWIAFGILVGGVSFLKDFSGPAPVEGTKIIPLTSFDNELFLVSSLVMILIGAVWFVKGLLGRRALVMTDSHVSGFTLFGTKTIRWQDVSHVKVQHHETYSKEVQIHAKRGTPSSSLFLNCVPIYVSLTDKSADDVLAAIRYFRPDL